MQNYTEDTISATQSGGGAPMVTDVGSFKCRGSLLRSAEHLRLMSR